MTEKQRFNLYRIICSATFFTAGIIIRLAIPLLAPYSLILFILAAFTVGYDVIIDAVNGIIHGHLLDENFLMSAGSICAFILGEYAEGTVILLLYQVGEFFQSVAVGKSRNSISTLMNICPDEARLEDGSIVDPFDVSVGEIILVLPGEKIPLDGVIVAGTSTLDTSSLTGESLPVSAAEGDSVISGTVNLTGPLKIEVVKEFSESTVSKILELVENASDKKAKLESFVTRFAKYYTPAVVIAALLVALLPPLLFNAEFSVWLLRAVMFIVISCPCALVVSVPLSFFGALGTASKCGVLVKGANYLEAMSALDTIVFDKTGTLTEGSFTVHSVVTAECVSEEKLKEIAVLSEYYSSHPIGLSIKNAFGKITPPESFVYENIAGKGIKITCDDRLILSGNADFLTEFGVSPEKTPEGFTAVHLYDGGYLGYILLGDKIKESSKEAISKLNSVGIKTVMLTGDNEKTAEKVANELNIGEYHASLLPDDKVHITEEILKNANGKVAFVGDGINDAPVLARTDIGIAMGALGSDAAIEAADVVIMNDDLSLLPRAIMISKKAVRISKQNIAFSLIIKFSQLALSLVGLGTVWMAVFADVGVLILAIANSLRTLKK